MINILQTQTKTDTHTFLPFSLSSSSPVTVETKTGNIIDLLVANQLPTEQKLKLKHGWPGAEPAPARGPQANQYI